MDEYYAAAFEKTDFAGAVYHDSIILFQAADVHCRSKGKMAPLHTQRCDEITLVYGGEGEIRHGDALYPVSKGSLHICFEGDTHQMIPSRTAPMHFYCIGYKIDAENPLFGLSEKIKERIRNGEASVTADLSHLGTPLRRLCDLLHGDHSDELADHMIKNTLNYIILTALTSFDEVKEPSRGEISAKDDMIFYVISYLKENMYDIDALKRLPHEMGYSYSYISHVFSRKMEQSLGDFFYTIRMEAASELLKEKSVTEVSETLGYSSIHAFSRAHKNYLGSLKNPPL